MFSKALNNYFEVLSNPAKAFGVIFSEKLPMWIPLLLIIVTTVVGTQFIYDQALDMQINLVEYNPQIDEDQVDQVVSGMEMAKEPPLRYFATTIPAIFVPIIYAIIALLIFITGNFIFGGKATYGDVFTLITYASAVAFIQWVAQILITVISGAGPTFFSPAAFLPIEEFYTTTFKLLSTLDIFQFWSIAVVGIGLKKLYDFSLSKAMSIPVGIYVLYVVLFKVIF